VSDERGLAVSCQEVVELVTDYIEGRLDAQRRSDVDAHLALCDPCVVYVEQMRETIRTLGRVPLETLPDEAKRTLVDAFRAQLT